MLLCFQVSVRGRHISVLAFHCRLGCCPANVSVFPLDVIPPYLFAFEDLTISLIARRVRERE